MNNDRELVNKILKVKFVLGVSYRKMAEGAGVHSSAIYHLRNGNPIAMNTEKKERLMKILDNYLRK